MIETSGERYIGGLPKEVIKIVDVKCPDSGEPDTFDMANLDALTAKDEVKFVLATRCDYEFARDFARRHGLLGKVREVLFSPVFEDPEGKWPGLEPQRLAEWILADRLRVRLGDRKSTRLNSSHGYISYAVFCLKKKKIHPMPATYLQSQECTPPTCLPSLLCQTQPYTTTQYDGPSHLEHTYSSTDCQL